MNVSGRSVSWAMALLLLVFATACSFSLVACSSVSPRGVGTRTVGVDFGLRRVGIALSSGFAPLPIAILDSGGGEEEAVANVAKGVAQLMAGEGATQVVLGMPYNSSGGEGEQAQITLQFATVLADAVAPHPVFLWDERFSSAEVRRAANCISRLRLPHGVHHDCSHISSLALLRAPFPQAKMRMHSGQGAGRGEQVDHVAAAVILEDFFDADEEALSRAPHVPSTRPIRLGPRPPPPPPLPSASEVRRAMMARVAEEQQQQGGRSVVKKKKKKR